MKFPPEEQAEGRLRAGWVGHAGTPAVTREGVSEKIPPEGFLPLYHHAAGRDPVGERVPSRRPFSRTL
ncbi:hypothetical protein hamaS1_31370 [Moorella sp. Hama-1]|nr:hypothetical protein hamaS1_31370 [Moorella sp. Hama-1]